MSEQNSFSTFALLAARYYRDFEPEYTEEFFRDLTKFTLIDKMLARYEKDESLNTRLILNYLIILGNVFEIEGLRVLFEYRIKNKKTIKPFLQYLNYLRPNDWQDIPTDLGIIVKLREL
jgi:predicted solute-binding protein